VSAAQGRQIGCQRQLFLERLPLLAVVALLVPSLALAKGKRPGKPAPLAPSALAGEIVPASAPGALLLDGAQATQGLLAWLGAAGQAAPSLDPKFVSQDLTRSLGVDPLASGAESGLAPEGPRAIVLDPRALGFSAPVADEARAKQVLQTWLGQLGPVRPTRSGPLKGPLASGGGDQVRAGMLAKVAGSLRLITASGRGAVALVAELGHVGRKAQDNPPLGADKTLAAALVAVSGPVRAWSRGEGPLLGTLVAITADASGLRARGLILPAPSAPALLDGLAPPASACDGIPLFCARAAPGPALRALGLLFARELVARELLGRQRDALDALIQNALALSSGPVLLRLEGLNARALGEPEQLLAALPSSLSSGLSDALKFPETLPAPWSALPAPQSGILLSPQTNLCVQTQAAQAAQPGALWLSAPCAALPAHFNDPGGAKELATRFDPQALARALGPLSALDALRGPLAAGAFAGKLLWGELLARSGPIDFAARPSPLGDAPGTALAGALDLTFAWPLSIPPSAK
jgi:hypothetical protein